MVYSTQLTLTMKKYFLAIFIAILSFNIASACQICGCGLGNYYIGLLPQFNTKFLGLRYNYRSFHTSITGDASQFSNDYNHAIELWTGWNIGKKWQVLAIVPFNNIHQVSDDGITDKNGIGDIAVMVNYKLFEKKSMAYGKNIFQQFWVGGGIKLPTGKFNIDPTGDDLIAEANTQMGTASTDFLVSSMYSIRINKFGVNTSATYKMNTSNTDKYEFGNKLSINSLVYYSISRSRTVIIPNAGIVYENTGANKLQSQKIDQTGGYLVAGAAGLEVGFTKFTIGANAQLPVAQNFADGQTKTKFRGMLHITFTL